MKIKNVTTTNNYINDQRIRNSDHPEDVISNYSSFQEYQESRTIKIEIDMPYPINHAFHELNDWALARSCYKNCRQRWEEFKKNVKPPAYIIAEIESEEEQQE